MRAIDIQKQNSGSFELSKKKNLREMFNNPLFLLECTIQIWPYIHSIHISQNYAFRKVAG